MSVSFLRRLKKGDGFFYYTAMSKENDDKKLFSTSELAKKLNCQNRTINDNGKALFPDKIIENGVMTYWTEREATEIIEKIKHNQANQTYLASTSQGVSTTLTNEMTIKKVVEGAKKQLSIEEQTKMAFQLQASILQQMAEQNAFLEKDNKELRDWKSEKLYIENEKYKAKELRAKINKRIRQVAKDKFDDNYKECWNYFYKKYNTSHCFAGEQNIDLIQERGHLKEFYNLVLFV